MEVTWRRWCNVRLLFMMCWVTPVESHCAGRRDVPWWVTSVEIESQTGRTFMGVTSLESHCTSSPGDCVTRRFIVHTGKMHCTDAAATRRAISLADRTRTDVLKWALREDLPFKQTTRPVVNGTCTAAVHTEAAYCHERYSNIYCSCRRDVLSLVLHKVDGYYM